MGIATLVLGMIPTLIGNIPGISAAIKQIIADVSGATSAVLASGAISQPSVNTILAAWAGVVATLKNDPTLAASMAAIGQLEKIVQATLLEDAQLAKSVDWTVFHPITPVA